MLFYVRNSGGKKMEIILVIWIVVIETLTADIRETKQF